MTQRVGGDTTTIQWNFDNKPTSITKGGTTVSFAYDGNGQRVKKTFPSQTVLYFGSAYEKRGGVGIIHLFAGSQRIASVRPDGTTQFYHPDHLGSSWIVTDPNGAIKESNEFHPFGTYHEAIEFDPSFPDVNYTFTGQEEDGEVGLYNYGARLYDPELGRFISPDSIVPDPGDLQALNRYSYCLNNPLIYVDPSGEYIFGLAPLLFWTLVGSSMAMGALAGAANAQIEGGSWVKGALIGAGTAGVASVASLGITNFLFPGVFIAEQFAQMSVVERVAAAAVGGFTAGAVQGGLSAAFTGGNVWQGALYGGLAGAAFAGLVAGAIELNGWGNSSGFGGTGGAKGPEGEPNPDLLEYTNPTGRGMRVWDSQGGGYWEAYRSGGRLHKGIDFVSVPGQDVIAPFEGRAGVDKFNPEDTVAVAGKSHYARIRYVKISEAVVKAGAAGLKVNAGDTIGTALDISTKYPGIIIHVHFELYTYKPWRPINPESFFFRGR